MLACQEVLKWVLPSRNQNRLLFIRIQTLPPTIHHKWKESIDFVCKSTNGYSYGINYCWILILIIRTTLFSSASFCVLSELVMLFSGSQVLCQVRLMWNCFPNNVHAMAFLQVQSGSEIPSRFSQVHTLLVWIFHLISYPWQIFG